MFLRVFKHLLPTGRAWRITTEKKLRQFFEGLTSAPEDVRDYADNVFDAVFPQTTGELPAWENQFGLVSSGLTEQARRDRLEATWKALGGQDPRYIQDTLQANGFDVYVHEWWVPGTEPAVGVQGAATPRNPFDYLVDVGGSVKYVVECGEPLAECGETGAEAGNTANTIAGYPLVNKLVFTSPDYIVLSGKPDARSGEPEALAGNFVQFTNRRREYAIPPQMDKWPYFLYIGGETFPTLATVPASRRDEFEDLCLKICPAQQWLGMLINYS